MRTEKIYSHTLGLCPICRQKVQARIIQEHGQVYMEKFCPKHGKTRVIISSDVEWFEKSADYVKPGQEPLNRNVAEFTGCPESCGFCPQHQQHTCLPVIEITSNCQLRCPVCLKGFKTSFTMSTSDFDRIIDNLFYTEGKVDVINISGGEPLCHPEFEKIIQIALEKGVSQVTVSTNGIALLREKRLRDLFKETRTIVALQFDGFLPETYKYIRGKDLSKQKLQLIEVLEREGILYSLVSTILKEVNDREIKTITDFFFQSKALTLMFQPIVFTGKAGKMESEKHRMTIPCIIHEIQQSHYIKKGDFNPLPCSHFSCFALSYYLKVDNDQFYSLKEFLGEENLLNVCANKTLPGLDHEGYSIMRNRMYDLWSAADSATLNEKVLKRVKEVLKSMDSGQLTNSQKIALGAAHMKGIFIHHFMDLHTMDFGRLVKCCNPYPQVNDRLIPMCAENVFFEKD
jgi:uncharacterized radical SAM superfamily Fe-S cluster-containing enzyme